MKKKSTCNLMMLGDDNRYHPTPTEGHEVGMFFIHKENDAHLMYSKYSRVYHISFKDSGLATGYKTQLLRTAIKACQYLIKELSSKGVHTMPPITNHYFKYPTSINAISFAEVFKDFIDKFHSGRGFLHEGLIEEIEL